MLVAGAAYDAMAVRLAGMGLCFRQGWALLQTGRLEVEDRSGQ